MNVALNIRVPDVTEVVVIGGGLGGLTTAIELARHGISVCVFDKEMVPGGYAQSFRRRGFHFDLSLHHVGGFEPGCFVHGCLMSLGVLEKLNVFRTETLFRVEFPDFQMTLPNNREGIISLLCARFPAERSGILSLFDFLPRLKADVISPLVISGFNTPFHDRLSPEYLERSYQELLTEHISDPILLSVMGQMWPYVGLPPSQTGANYAACLNATAFIEGEFGIVGGGAALVRGMVERLRELGGECFAGKEVQRILVSGDGVTGIELTDGKTISSRAVVLASSPVYGMNRLLPPGFMSEIYRYRLDNMVPSLSAYSMHLGLNCVAEEMGMEGASLFVNHDIDLDNSFERILRHNIEHTDYSVSCSTTLRTSVAPDGCSILSFRELTPASDWLTLTREAYQRKKERVSGILLSKYEKRFPDLSKHLEVKEFVTPASFFRYTWNQDGALFGFAQTVEQSNNRRLRNRTPVKGLFLAGAWTSAGGGYEGVLAGGIDTAGAVMSDCRFPLTAQCVQLWPEKKSSVDSGEDEISEVAQPLILFDDAVSMDSHYRHRFPVMVYGDELNSRGNADAASYLKYMDRARMELIEEIGGNRADRSWFSDYQIKVYRIEARCATVTRMADCLDVRTGIRRISHHRVSFDQRIVHRGNGRIVADAAIEVLFLDSQDRLVSAPDGLLNTDDASPDFKRDRTAPLPFREDERFPFRTRFRVYFEDTDLQSIMYHVSYVKYCERAMFDLVRSIWPDISTNIWMARTNATVARIDIRFLKAAVLGDRLEVRTTLVGMDHRRLCFGQRIVNVRTGKVLSDAMTDIEFRDNQGKSLPVPRQISDIAKAHLHEMGRR